MSFTPRLFLPSVSQSQNEIVLDESASRYLVKVLRMAEGAQFGGFDSQGHQYELVLKKAGLPQVIATVLSRYEPSTDFGNPSITLGQSLPKASKMDLILRQGTEIGVNRFIPLVTQRSVSRPDASQYGHKNERWQKILVEACRQCGRNDLPQLDPVIEWGKLLETFGEFNQVLLPYEKQAPTLKTVLESNFSARKILILIGPEGGWAPEEVKEAEEKGAMPIHLPTPILRTETAGIAVVSMIQFFYGSPTEGAK
jgi:16S rRNA (uracil1498-N3)-methyltransferase